jgi:hypothetical protein
MAIWTLNEIQRLRSGNKSSEWRIVKFARIVAQLLSILALLNDHSQRAFTSGLLIKPVSGLFLQLSEYFTQNKEHTWRTRSLQVIAFLQKFQTKQRTLFKL